MKLKKKLFNFFGFTTFKPQQRKIVKESLGNKDIFVIMPTGGGKSLCYQLPALIDDNKTTIVISPLCSLIKDQTDKLIKNVTKQVDFINGEKQYSEILAILNDINAYRLIYCTPEAIIKYKDTLQEYPELISRIIIDEAHCISNWGHDFRPSYSRLGEIREFFPGVPISAYTATAPKKVKKDVIASLKLKDPIIFEGNYFRENLKLYVHKRPNDSTFEYKLRELLTNKLEGSGIIYCTSRKSCEKYAEIISEYTTAKPYHAGLSNKKRTAIQDAWINDKTRVICATIAFGMGIDKLNTRWVIHANLPKCLTSYYQEIGRAGRDGETAECHLFYSYRDKIIIQKMLKRNNMSKSSGFLSHQINSLHETICFAESTTMCRHRIVSAHLGQIIPACENSCDICLSGKTTKDIDITEQGIQIMKELQKNPISRSALRKKLNISETIIVWLILEKYLKECIVPNKNGFWYEQLKLYRKCENIMNNKKRISMVVPSDFFLKEPDKKTEITVEIGKLPSLTDKGRDLKYRLETFREYTSRNLNIPKWRIFSEKSMHYICAYPPETIDDLHSIRGIGKKTVEKYGKQIMNLVGEM